MVVPFPTLTDGIPGVANAHPLMRRPIRGVDPTMLMIYGSHNGRLVLA